MATAATMTLGSSKFVTVSEGRMTQYMKRLFTIGDKHKDGTIDAVDLEGLLQQSGFNFPRRVISRILMTIDTGRDGTILVEQYLHAVSIIREEAKPLNEQHRTHRDMVTFSTEIQAPRCLTWVHRRRAKVQAAKRQRAASSKAAQQTAEGVDNNGLARSGSDLASGQTVSVPKQTDDELLEPLAHTSFNEGSPMYVRLKLAALQRGQQRGENGAKRGVLTGVSSLVSEQSEVSSALSEARISDTSKRIYKVWQYFGEGEPPTAWPAMPAMIQHKTEKLTLEELQPSQPRGEGNTGIKGRAGLLADEQSEDLRNIVAQGVVPVFQRSLSDGALSAASA